MIRAFIAVEIDPLVLRRIHETTDALRRKISDIRWTSPANWHLTLKFLGAIDEKQIDPIGQALEHELSLFPHCIINAKGVGVFPDARRPRILWVGIEGESLQRLAEAVDIALAPLGFEKEKRVFTPHLTIGRWREGKRQSPGLKEALENSRAYEFGRSQVEEVKLFQSILKPAGAEYRLLRSVRLRVIRQGSRDLEGGE